MKDKAHAGDFQVQDSVKKKKKKRKPIESNNNHENAEGVEDAEPGPNSPVLFEDAAAQAGEGREKKKKLKKKGEKQQTVLDKYFGKVEHEISNGIGAAASLRKKRKRKDSSHELSDVSCVSVNVDCQEEAADYVYFKKQKKKRKEKHPEEDELCELPPSEEHSKGHKEKSKKKRKKRREGSGQEDTDGAAEAPLSPSGQDRGAGEEGGSDAASAITEVSVELPAGFSTPSKAAGRAERTPALAKKACKSSPYVMEESSSDSDVM